jgi:hypothetical protein
MMKRQDELDGQTARAKGRQAWVKDASTKGDRSVNSYKAGSWLAYCFDAGYRQDVRSIDELWKDWNKAGQGNPYMQVLNGARKA